MTSFRCFRTRRRLGAFLDQALPEGQSRAIDAHFSACSGCRGEAMRLRRLSVLLSGALQSEPEPDWSSFWPSIRRRLLVESDPPLGFDAWWRPAWSRGRLAFGGALVGLLLLTAALWQSGPWRNGTEAAPRVVVSSVETVQPNSSVMVFSSADSEMTMIWVFGLEHEDDHSFHHSDPAAGGWV